MCREPRVKFYDVPKLGSYMAIELTYKSCLQEGALDDAIVDFLEVKDRID